MHRTELLSTLAASLLAGRGSVTVAEIKRAVNSASKILLEVYKREKLLQEAIKQNSL